MSTFTKFVVLSVIAIVLAFVSLTKNSSDNIDSSITKLQNTRAEQMEKIINGTFDTRKVNKKDK